MTNETTAGTQPMAALAPVVVGAALALFLCVNALIQHNHDESQYVAAAVLSSDLLIYRDFMSNQPPLHAWLFAPLPLLFPAWPFLAMRLATAALALAVIASLYGTQRRLGIPPFLALFACFAMMSCSAFLFGAGLVRNDMLPAAFACGAMFLLARADAGTVNRVAAGVLFGLAVSTKASWVPVAAAAFGFVLVAQRRALPAFVAGGLIGGLPLLAAFAAAPGNFLYGVIEHGSTAPHDWYTRAGRSDALGFLAKAASLMRSSLRGPAGVAVLIVLVDVLRHWRSPGRERWLVWMLCAGGAVAALIPTPSHEQYLIPLLPPLFAALGLALHGMSWRWPALVLVLVFALAELFGTARLIQRSADRGLAIITIRDNARWVGRQVRANGAPGRLATLVPERVVDSGVPLDPRFATGPFIYRSGSLLSDARAIELKSMTPSLLNREDFRPAAILTGYEQAWGPAAAPDASLVAWAKRNGYTPRAAPDGTGTLWLVPEPATASDSSPARTSTRT